MCGILTDRDIAMKVAGEERDPLTTMVEEVMTRDPVRISVDRGRVGCDVADAHAPCSADTDNGQPGDRSWNRHHG